MKRLKSVFVTVACIVAIPGVVLALTDTLRPVGLAFCGFAAIVLALYIPGGGGDGGE